MTNTMINSDLLLSNANSNRSFSRAINLTDKIKDQDQKAVTAAKEFESFFISYMYKEMRKTIPSGGIIKKSQAEKMFEEMLDEKYANKMVDSGGIGLSNFIIEHLRVKNENNS